MKLAELASKPKLISLTIDDEDIVKRYGDSLEFWIYDRQDMTTFMKLARANEENMDGVTEAIGQLLLDEDGSKILGDGEILPVDVMFKVIEKTVNNLGNFASQTSTE